MRGPFVFVALTAALASACTGSEKAPPPQKTEAGGAAAPVAPPPRVVAVDSSGRVAVGEATTLTAQLPDPVLSSVVKPGDRVRAVVIGNVTDADGDIVIPSHSELRVRVVRLDRTGTPGATGVPVEFAVDSLILRGIPVPFPATVGPVSGVVTATGIVLVDRATTLNVTLTRPLSVVIPVGR